MAYAVLADVQARLPQFELTSTTKPNVTQVEGFLDDASVEFDTRVATIGYTTPFTGAAGLAWARLLVTRLAEAATLEARAAAVGGEAALQSAIRAREWVEAQFTKAAKGEIVIAGEAGDVEGSEGLLTGRIRGFPLECEDDGPRIWMGKVF